jgi:peroxiredoxin
MKPALRSLLLLAAVVAAAFGYVEMAERKGYPLKAGGPAPDFRLPSLQGGEVELRSVRGRPVVLNFWATWCPPCVVEMPSLERLHKTLGPEGLAVLAVSADEDEARLRRFVEENALTLPVLRDPGGRTAASAYRTTGYPETFVLDRNGIVQQHYVGPAEWDTPEAIAHFRHLIAAAGGASAPAGAAPREAAP